jgi:hypothetical protein
MMRGLSTRNYEAVVKDFHTAYGIEKSTVSENFIEASREKVKQLMERPLGELRLCAVLIDGTPFKDRQMIVALGIGCDGRKTVLGIREGATENATVVSALLSELVERGLDFSTPRLYILDGGKALRAAVRRHAGEAAFIKKRNVVDPSARDAGAPTHAWRRRSRPSRRRCARARPAASRKAWRKHSPFTSCASRSSSAARCAAPT